MKNYLFVFTLLLICSTFLNAQDSKLKVSVINLDDREGKISMGLFNIPESFPKKNEGKIGRSITIDGNKIVHVFDSLKAGTYALAIFHDENSNGKLDRSFMGWPVEDYVFSNYATGNFGPPSFEDASFELTDSLEIILEFK